MSTAKATIKRKKKEKKTLILRADNQGGYYWRNEWMIESGKEIGIFFIFNNKMIWNCGKREMEEHEI